MNIAEALKKVNDAIDAAGIPDDLREVAFGKAFDALMAGGQVQAGQGGSSEEVGRASTQRADQNSVFGRIGSALGISADESERLFDEHEGSLQFIGDVDKLGSSKAKMVLRLAVVLAVARQAGGYDEAATLDGTIRDEADRHGLYDATNYTKHIKEMKAFANVNGSGKTATYKVKHEGKKAAKEIALTLLSES